MKTSLKTKRYWGIISIIMLICASLFSQNKPNVILILTDDQGYGDWGHKGKHPYLKTPNIDKLANEGVYCSNFHTNVLCAPSRAAIMTGHDAFKMRVWQGRHEMRADYPTMANIFEDNGYNTALFGKWHLGDSYPFRPMDRGFQEVVRITSGMITTSADYPGNDLTDDKYLHNGVWEQYQGYSTDVWFGEAIKYIEKKRHENFFVYLSIDAPHAPHRATAEDKAPYTGIDFPNTTNDDKVANFYGQIASVDRNLAILRNKLDQLNLSENTILIFMSDNGSAVAGGVWNGGLKGGKASSQEGGHRVPFFIHWPKGGMAGGREITELTSHTDLVPSLINMCNLTPPSQNSFDGLNISPLLKGQVSSLPERTLFNRYSTSEFPPGPGGCVSKGDFRLFYSNGALFDVSKDLSQENNLGFSSEYRSIKTAMVADAKANHDYLVKNAYDKRSLPILGSVNQNPTELHAINWYTGKINDAEKNKLIIAWNSQVGNPTGRIGYWYAKAEITGTYKFSLYRYMKELGVPLRGKHHPKYSTALDIRKAKIIISGDGFTTINKEVSVNDNDIFAELSVNLPANVELKIEAQFINGSNQVICGPLSVDILRTSGGNTPPQSSISSPASNSTFDEGSSIAFTGTGTDSEDGNLGDSSLFWSSSIDGDLGSGKSLSTKNLSIGTHKINLRVSDSQGLNHTSSINLIVNKISNPPPSGDNLALNGIATQSSSNYGGIASRAIDGNTDGTWSKGSVTHTNKNLGYSQWWQVDLGKSFNLEKINIFNRKEAPERLTNYYVFVSDKPFSSSDINTTINESSWNSGLVSQTAGSPSIFKLNATGRYVRVQLKSQGEFLSLAEVEVFAGESTPPPTNQNIAINGTASQSSTSYGGIASRAIDGNTDGTWNNASVTATDYNQRTSPWWQVDLGQSYKLTKINIYNRKEVPERLTNYYVFVSDKPFSSSDINTTINESSWNSGLVSLTAGSPSIFNLNATGRYVRVQLKNHDYLSLAEVQIFAGESTPPPTNQNIATNGTASQSSENYGGSASKAIDGNTDGGYFNGSVTHTKANQGSSQWWQIDLGKSYNLTKVNLFNRREESQRLSNYYVYVSDKPFSSNSINTSLSESNWNSGLVSQTAGFPTSFNLNTSGRFLRVQLQN